MTFAQITLGLVGWVGLSAVIWPLWTWALAPRRRAADHRSFAATFPRMTARAGSSRGKRL